MENTDRTQNQGGRTGQGQGGSQAPGSNPNESGRQGQGGQNLPGQGGGQNQPGQGGRDRQSGGGIGTDEDDNEAGTGGTKTA